jgi:anionic cell wall polymer biosynthesis LytR-Cps2A-Psr (LCP) family protein
MGTTFVVMTTLKLCVMGGVGIGLTVMYQYFNNFEFKSSKKKEKGGESDVSGIGESLRQKSRSLS